METCIGVTHCIRQRTENKGDTVSMITGAECAEPSVAP